MPNEVGALLNDIGNVLALDTAYPLDGTFLYVEAGWHMVSVSVFKDLDERLLYREEMDELDDIVYKLWYAESPEKRWSTMQYSIDGGRFDASFTYEALDPDRSTIDRREAILRQRFGNKQIVYPPLE